jgi:hypothetical protein
LSTAGSSDWAFVPTCDLDEQDSALGQHMMVSAIGSVLNHVDPLVRSALGLVFLAFIVYGKWADYRFRKQAVLVPGTVRAKVPRRRYTSYYISYRLRDVDRVAEYCGPPLRALWQEGDSVEILIDPSSPPSTNIPEGPVTWSGSGSGNCSVPDRPLLSMWDYMHTLIAAAVIVEGLFRHFR